MRVHLPKAPLIPLLIPRTDSHVHQGALRNNFSSLQTRVRAHLPVRSHRSVCGHSNALLLGIGLECARTSIRGMLICQTGMLFLMTHLQARTVLFLAVHSSLPSSTSPAFSNEGLPQDPVFFVMQQACEKVSKVQQKEKSVKLPMIKTGKRNKNKQKSHLFLLLKYRMYKTFKTLFSKFPRIADIAKLRNINAILSSIVCSNVCERRTDRHFACKSVIL